MPIRPYTGKRAETGFKSTGKSRTKQSFKDECDINRVLDRGIRGASLAHLKEHEGQYGDFADMDEQSYELMLTRIADAKSIFFDLPAELRQNEFDNNVGKFFEFVNNPANIDKLEEIFPSISAPGRQMPAATNPGEPATPVEPTAPPAPSEPPVTPTP